MVFSSSFSCRFCNPNTLAARTPEYHDEVLKQKIKSLVCVVFALPYGTLLTFFCSSGVIENVGAVKEEGVALEHHMSYESFVRNLDENDLFTKSLVEILVKVLASLNSPLKVTPLTLFFTL